MIMSQEISIAVVALIGLSNCLGGGLIGICGIAGFLLPIFYTGALGYTVDMALAYSFLAFLVSGILGSVNYKRAGNLDVPMSLRLGIGSFAGAVAGVFLQALIPKTTAKVILYLVVLISGVSILFRMWRDKKAIRGEDCTPAGPQTMTLLLLGLITGMICSLSGAGGPVLVMPLLIILGVSARTAVGVALFDSVFIAVPACAGYLARIDVAGCLPVLLLIAAAHGLGVLVGSRMAGSVPVNRLKQFVAVFSVGIALYMLYGAVG